MASMIMKKAGFTGDFYPFQMGGEAMTFIRQIPSENIGSLIIFCDVNMPVMNGWQFLDVLSSFISENDLKICVILMSSTIDTRDIENAKNYPFLADFITKPLNIERVQNILASYLPNC